MSRATITHDVNVTTRNPSSYLTEATRIGANCCHDVARASTRATPAISGSSVGGSSLRRCTAVGVGKQGDCASKGTVGRAGGCTGVKDTVSGSCACGLEGSLGSDVKNASTHVVVVGDHDG